ncbi:BON domain-containing protein [Oceanibaculum pacificum]|uniref:BON domain-containing protein n=1 Tax=Oceanibaculum pacificum TaxID=580166 RepID=A0A154WGB7_9PROT|nr:BON domain-containing protein [Oceanibaculum pacificum]KZD12568.1 hypothetical protein AUP43_04220 [Oceanibaculum pacificum]
MTQHDEGDRPGRQKREKQVREGDPRQLKREDEHRWSNAGDEARGDWEQFAQGERGRAGKNFGADEPEPQDAPWVDEDGPAGYAGGERYESSDHRAPHHRAPHQRARQDDSHGGPDDRGGPRDRPHYDWYPLEEPRWGGGRGYGAGFGYGAGYRPGAGFPDAREGAQRQAEQPGPHRGRGPSGYKRSDARISEDVHDRLTEDPFVDASQVEINVAGGEVTLDGQVGTRAAKRRAEDIVEAVSGVTHCQNNLRVGVSR